MLLIPVAIAAVLLLAGGGLAALLLKRVYLPRLGLSMAALHETGEQLEAAFAGAKVIAVIYGSAVVLALLAVLTLFGTFVLEDGAGRSLLRSAAVITGSTRSRICLTSRSTTFSFMRINVWT